MPGEILNRNIRTIKDSLSWVFSFCMFREIMIWVNLENSSQQKDSLVSFKDSTSFMGRQGWFSTPDGLSPLKVNLHFLRYSFLGMEKSLMQSVLSVMQTEKNL